MPDTAHYASVASRTARPLLMALTGTPLINDIDDFRAIWQFLGWIDETEPLAELMGSLERTGLTRRGPGSRCAALLRWGPATLASVAGDGLRAGQKNRASSSNATGSRSRTGRSTVRAQWPRRRFCTNACTAAMVR